MSGILYIVASPIGCLQDISARALTILREVDLIACEDTRHSATLLRHYQINTQVLAYHSHNEAARSDDLLARLQAGTSIALLSDAGTPLIQDPGQSLVAKAQAMHVPVVPIPGPCALITALSAAGLPGAQFVFAGFLPVKAGARSKQLQSLAQEARTLVFYEAPHRILASLQAMVEVFGETRRAVIARELTKVHETILTDTLVGLLATVSADPNQQKGEFVVLVQGSEAAASEVCEVSVAHVLAVLQKELPLKQAASLTAQITGAGKNAVYQLGLTQSR